MQPLVSIVVPAYCHEQYIHDCLDSLVAQTYQNIELIVIDDCSKDSTYEILLDKKSELEKRFKNVIILQNEQNLGVVKTENKLISLSNGKYIKSIASDDMLLENAISDLVEFYEENSFYDIIFSNALFCNEEESYSEIKKREHKKAYNYIPDLTGNVMQKLYENDFIQAPTVMIKRETFDTFGVYDEQFAIEDWEYWLRIAERGSIGYCDSITVGYRISSQSLSHFSFDEDGRRRLRNMYNNQKLILTKYQGSEKIDEKKGFTTFYHSMLHEAIDLEAKDLQKEILEGIKESKIKINFETKMKYVFYKLHLLRMVQAIKRRLGMQTVDLYKIQK